MRPARLCLPYYAIVSGTCFLLNNAILIVMTRMGAPLALSIGASFVIVGFVGYVLHSLVSFRRSLEIGTLARYMAAMSANIPLALVMLWLWRDVVACRIEIAAPAATVCATLVNFALCRLVVFDRRGDAPVHP